MSKKSTKVHTVDTRRESMVIARVITPIHYELCVLLSPKSLGRMKQADPFDRLIKSLGRSYDRMILHRFSICTPSEADFQKIERLSQKNLPEGELWKEVEKILYRGYNFDERTGDGSPVVDVRGSQEKSQVN